MDSERAKKQHKAKTRTRITGIVSDIHFPHHNAAAWGAFMHWADINKPDHIIVLGDALDLSIMGRFDKSGDEPGVVEEIRVLVEQMNLLLSRCGKLTYSMGNHEQRYRKFLMGASAHVLRGLRGLTLQEQCRAHGLDERIVWHEESIATGALTVSNFILRHGHVGGSRFGGGKFPARVALGKTYGTNLIEAHHHRADVATATAFGKTTICIANPCMVQLQDYAGINANWQLGFTILESNYPDHSKATANVIVIEDGCFGWGGRTYSAQQARSRAA